MNGLSMPAINHRAPWPALVGAALLAVALLAMLAAPSSKPASAQSCSGPFTIDFAGLPAGTILGEQYAPQGVHISGVANGAFPDALIVFDSNSTDAKLDPDLRVGIGNIAIFAKNLTDVNPADGLVDRPDENDVGGTATFAFDQDMSIGSVKWIDKDHVVDNFVVAYNAAGEVIVSVPVPLGANASVQTIAINADGVRRLEFVYAESGGFTGIEVDCGQVTPTPTQAQATETPAPTPTEAPTPTAAATETPTSAPTATPSPTAGTSTQSPPTGSPAPSPTVAAAVQPPSADTSVAAGPSTGGAQALPAGGGPQPNGEGAVRWAGALTVLALVLGGSVVTMRRERR